MSQILITCPETGKPVSTGWDMDKQSFDSATMTGNKVRCPHCGKTHEWEKEDAHLEDAGGGA